MKSLKCLVLSVGVSAFGVAFAGGASVQPGLWEIHDKVVMHGVPYSPPPQTYKECVTATEAKNFWRDLQHNKDKNCRYTDVKISGNRASWHMQCNGKGGATQGTATAVIDGPTRYHAASDMTSSAGGRSFKIHVETTGRRLGACK